MGGIGQQSQKQIGQTGIPIYNVVNACATGATAVRTVVPDDQGRRGRHGSRHRRRADGQDGPARRRRGARRREERVRARAVATAASCPSDGWLGSGTMPAVFGQAGMEYAYENDGVGFEQFAKVAEKNHAHSALNPLAQYNKVFSLEEIMEARVISYPNTLPMCCPTGDGAAAIVLVSGVEAQDALARAAEARGQDRRVGAHQRPVDRRRRGRSPTSTRSPATRPTRRTSSRASAPTTSTSSSCTTASPPPSCIHYDNLRAVRAGRRRRLHRPPCPVARRHDAGQRVRRAALEGPPDRHDRRGRRVRDHHAAAR